MRGARRARRESELDGDPRGDVHRRRGQRAREGHRPRRRPRSSTCWRESAGPAGRWIHHGLTSRDVLDTGAGAPAAARRRDRRCPARGELVAGARRRGARARRHALRRAHPRGARRADDVRDQARRASPSRPHRNRAAARARVRAGGGRRAVGRGRDLRGARRPTSRQRVLARLGLAREPVSTQVVRARPPRRAAAGDRARGRRPRALRHRDPPPRSAPRCARSRSRSGAGPEGLERDAAQAQPDHVRAHHRPRARPARQRAGRRSRTWRCGTSATSRTPSRRAGDPAGLDDPARLHAAPRARASCAGCVVDAERMRAQPRPDARRAVLPAGAAGAGRVRAWTRDDAYRIVQRAAQRAWDEGIALRDLLAADRGRRRSTSTRSSTTAAFVRYADEIVARLDAIVPATSRRWRQPASRTADPVDEGEMLHLRVSRDRCVGSARSIATVTVSTTCPCSPRARSGRSTTWATAADGRLRPHLDLRRRPPDADPGQGQGAHRAVGVLVRAHRRHRPQPPRLVHRRRARRGARPRRSSCASSRCCPSSASCAATSPARAGRTTSATGAVCGIELPAGPARVRAAARADLHARHQGRGRPRRDDRLRARRRDRRRPRAGRARARRLARALPARRRARARARDHPRRHEVRVRPRRGRHDRRSATRCCTPDSSRFWPADGYEPGRGQPSFDKQYVRDWASPARLGQVRRRRRRSPTTSSRARASCTSRPTSAITGEPFSAWLRADRGLVRARVLIRPKEGILDPQGQAVERALPALGFEGVEQRARRPAGRARRRGRRRSCRRCASSCSPTR